ncbi:MAG: thioredoxin domain-containing protein [Gammaproteobacteria bacterium]|nr:thioredoxin domain-containing protein [Gammaproteobacteria bacterium]MDP2140606.1 thioredoxin domain-containing protein [Gammaproteobacteria bacterium]MDP2347378.1 thioredoxin domain-containing protein [Gammaproteobacteria bacterium]
MSKREEQKKIREQKQRESEQRTARQKLVAKIAMFVLGPLLVITVIYAMMGQGEVYSPIEIAEVDHVRGNPEGVKLVVYADFQCPACANEHLLMAQAWNSIANRTQMVFRHYPLTTTHPHAWTAATYAEAAGRQGKFWEMYDLLFVNQAYWSTLGDVRAEFEGYIAQLGLDVERARVDIRADDLIQKIRNDQRSGTRSGVRSTPTIFVNGRLVPTPRTTAEIVALINAATAT